VIQNLHFVSVMSEKYSRSGVYYSYLKDLQNVKSDFCKVEPSGRNFFREMMNYRGYLMRQPSPRNVVVMSPSHKITIFLILIPKTNVILDAGWSLTESAIARRNSKGRRISILRNYCIDFVAFHSARKVLLESQHQVNYVSKKFLVPRKKLFSLSTGFDETQLQSEPNSQFQEKWESFKDHFADFKVITFRGKYNEESGLENLAEASHLLSKEKFYFIVVTEKLPPNLIFSHNTLVIERFIEWGELKEILKISDYYVGQLSFNKRLANTIPHKAFEAGYFGLPYITAQNSGVLESYSPSEAIYLHGHIPVEFAEKVRSLESIEIDMYRLAIARKYQKKLSQRVLAEQFLDILRS
jgi:glycosyltransferase involved in cell wall biosynthesis